MNMLKKIVILLLTASLLLGGLLTAQAELLSQSERYAAFQEQLHACLNGESGAMPLDDLTKRFESLGSYMKSAQFGYYTAILRDAEAGEDSRLALYTRLLRMDADFCAMLPEQGFPTVDEVEAYALGRQAQEKGDWNAAIEYYEQSIAVMDSMARVMELLTAEPTATATPVPTPEPSPHQVRKNALYGDFTIDVYSNGTCHLRKYSGFSKRLNIPAEIDGYRVTSIGERAFYLCKSLISISIPDSVASIGDFAFQGCSALTSISIPDSVTSIGKGAFRECFALTSIPIPDSVTSINDSTFSICLSLTSISIPDSVTSIGEYAFINCSSLTNVSIPDSVTSIGHYAFKYCEALTNISIPASVTSFGHFVFAFCQRLTLRVPAGSYAQQYAIENNIPYTTY